MRVRSRGLLVGIACSAIVLPLAAGCVKIGAQQPSPSPTASGAASSPASASPSVGTKTDDQILAGSRNSIVRIEGVDCDQAYSTGTGYLFQTGLVVTAYHVVKDQQTLSVRTLSSRVAEDHVFAGQVVGHNDAADVAVIRIEEGGAEVLTPAAADPAVNDTVYAVGFPGGQPLAQVTGKVTGVGQDTVITDGDQRRPLGGAIRFTAPPSAGTNGGPLLDTTGAVAGLVDTAPNADQVHYAVPGKLVQTLAAAAAASPEVKTPKSCGDGQSDDPIQNKSHHPDAPGIATTLRAYFTGINTGDDPVDSTSTSDATGYEQAYQQLSGSRLVTYPTLKDFRNAHRQRTSNVQLRGVNYIDDTTDRARVSYTYTDLGDGSCHRRTMDYTMSIATGVWTFADEHVHQRSSC